MNISNIRMDWYAVHVRSKCEFKVYDLLSKKGVDVFLATIEKLHRWKDRKKLLKFPLFPGYLFVHIYTTHEEMLSVLKTYGVVKFLGVTLNKPDSIPEEQIITLKKFVENKEAIDPYPYLKKGQRVRIKKGPLTGVEGILGEREGYHILIVLVDILQQGVAVKIDSSDVESI